MTLSDRIAPESLRKRRTLCIRTERLVLRAPRFEDAKTIATLVNDRRIAENTLRIPYPYGIADAQAFIAGANANSGETVFLITKRDATVLGACGVAERPAAPPRDRLLARRSILGQGFRHRSRTRDDRLRLRSSWLRGAPRRCAGDQRGLASGAGEVRLSVDGGRPLSHPIARRVRALRPFPARARG